MLQCRNACFQSRAPTAHRVVTRVDEFSLSLSLSGCVYITSPSFSIRILPAHTHLLLFVLLLVSHPAQARAHTRTHTHTHVYSAYTRISTATYFLLPSFCHSYQLAQLLVSPLIFSIYAMPQLTSNGVHPPRRNARSFDLDDSAVKAAAWVWHLHTSKPGVTTEGRFISSQSRRRRSGSYDRKVSRFRQEASSSTAATNTVGSGNKTEPPMWDCGSELYDTFELVAFGNQLDRSLMDAVPIRPRGGHPQEHHVKSPLHEAGGILRTLSLPRTLAQEGSKASAATPSPTADKFQASKSCNDGTRASSSSSPLRPKSSSTKWSGVGKLMNAIKRVVVLHKHVSFVGCRRSTDVSECSQRPIDPLSRRYSECSTRDNPFLVNENVRATTDNGGTVFMDDESTIQYTKNRFNSATMSDCKLSRDNESNHESNSGDRPSMQRKSRDYNSEGSVGGLSLIKKIMSNSERMSGGLSEHKKISKSKRKFAQEVASMKDRFSGRTLEGVYVQERIKGSDLEGVYVKERIKGVNEHLDLHKHLHHHHHYHHHHYLHHSLASESARLSPETLSHICAEQSWLI